MSMLATTSEQLAGAILFYAFALMSVGSALVVVISRNIVRTAVGLMFSLIGVAGLYFLLSAEFLAAVQLVIYVGGTLILIIFGVMLTSKSPFARLHPTGKEVALATVVGVVLLTSLVIALSNWTRHHPSVNTRSSEDTYAIAALGRALLGDYLVPFELASVILLTVMIGAAYLARGRRAS